MLKNRNLKIFTIVLASCPFVLFGQDANTELKFGVSAFLVKTPGITIQLSRILKDSRFKVSGNYHYKMTKPKTEIYNNGQLVYSQTDILDFHMYSVTIEYLLLNWNIKGF